LRCRPRGRTVRILFRECGFCGVAAPSHQVVALVNFLSPRVGVVRAVVGVAGKQKDCRTPTTRFERAATPQNPHSRKSIRAVGPRGFPAAYSRAQLYWDYFVIWCAALYKKVIQQNYLPGLIRGIVRSTRLQPTPANSIIYFKASEAMRELHK